MKKSSNRNGRKLESMGEIRDLRISELEIITYRELN